jgi:hypothetical protein
MKFHPDFVDKFKYVQTRYVIFDICEIKIVLKVYGEFEKLSKFRKYCTELFKLILPMANHKKDIINITIYDISRKKNLPERYKPIESKHINSGYTFMNSDTQSTNIVIYRNQELFKVLTHELLHFFNVIPHSHELQTLFQKRFESVANTINVNEALVEVNALILNCMIVSKLKNRDLQELLKNEYEFSKTQVSKLLYQQDVKLEDIFIDSFTWNEQTNAFSYFVLKHLFLHKYMDTTNTNVDIPITTKLSSRGIRMSLIEL